MNNTTGIMDSGLARRAPRNDEKICGLIETCCALGSRYGPEGAPSTRATARFSAAVSI
jgi:hypothetical protein